MFFYLYDDKKDKLFYIQVTYCFLINSKIRISYRILNTSFSSVYIVEENKKCFIMVHFLNQKSFHDLSTFNSVIN